MKLKCYGIDFSFADVWYCFSYSYDRVGGVGTLLVSLSPLNVNLVVFGGSPWG